MSEATGRSRCQLERHPAAQGVAGQVRALEPQLVEQLRDGQGQRGRRRFDTVGQRRRRAEPGQVDRDDVGDRREGGDDGVPGLPEGSEAVQEDERLGRCRSGCTRVCSCPSDGAPATDVTEGR